MFSHVLQEDGNAVHVPGDASLAEQNKGRAGRAHALPTKTAAPADVGALGLSGFKPQRLLVPLTLLRSLGKIPKSGTIHVLFARPRKLLFFFTIPTHGFPLRKSRGKLVVFHVHVCSTRSHNAPLQHAHFSPRMSLLGSRKKHGQIRCEAVAKICALACSPRSSPA